MIREPGRMITLRKSLTAVAIGLSSIGLSFDVAAKSAIIIDAESGKVLWQKDANTPRYPASTTKIMTALLLLENTLPTDWIVAPKGVEHIEESSLHLKTGEKVSARGMLYALMLRSANDGCVAVACHISKSVPEFAKLMNKRAKEIGCLNTTFNNPNGLNDKKHLTTAYDLALMAREAMKFDDFRKAVRTQKYTIVRSINHKDLLLKSHNKWLAKDMTADGIKTGYTRDAGKCYVGSATRNGYRIITVVLKTEDWQLDHQNMLNWAFKTHERVLQAAKGAEVLRLKLERSEPAEIPVLVDADVYHVRQLTSPEPVTVTPEYTVDLNGPIEAGQEIGTATFTDANGWKVVAPIRAGASTVPLQPLGRTTGGKAMFGILGLALFGGLASWYSRSRRAKSYAQAFRSNSF
jgi:serine-type D-Ala-D-Ala carboxypeptidase (penicillin-binding protein 5/6)